MKKLLLTASLVCAVTAAFAQGLVNPITAGASGYMKAVDQGGLAIDPAKFVAALYYGSGMDDSAFSMAPGLLNFNTSSAAAKGYITVGATKTVPTATKGGAAWVQIRAWSVGNGTPAAPQYDSYEAAKSSGDTSILIGKSIVVNMPSTGDPGPPAGTPVRIAWGGTAAAPGSTMVLMPVPEPSTIALAGLGLAGLLFIRRRK